MQLFILIQAAGFRGDIGYQSFLYSNVTEVRRVFMFLIERLPKDVEKDQLDDTDADRKTIFEHDLRQSIKIQLNAAWTPQYCKKFGARKFGNMIAIQASNHVFLPQRLNIPYATSDPHSSGKLILRLHDIIDIIYSPFSLLYGLSNK